MRGAGDPACQTPSGGGDSMETGVQGGTWVQGAASPDWVSIEVSLEQRPQ